MFKDYNEQERLEDIKFYTYEIEEILNLRETLKEIILLTSKKDESELVHGIDKPLGTIDELIDKAIVIIEKNLKNEKHYR